MADWVIVRKPRMIKYKRKKIPQSLRQATWLSHCGRVYETTCRCCLVARMTVFNFHCAHVISVARGGATNLQNLTPTCSTCNLSMGPVNLIQFQYQAGYKQKRFWHAVGILWE